METLIERMDKARRSHLVSNLKTLIDCVKATEEQYIHSIAKAKQTMEALQKFQVKAAPTTRDLSILSRVLNAWTNGRRLVLTSELD
jgi:tRNA C32,U32 (ribose-2'-O)-methylase TrmJ